ncbi:RHS repeat-associated core domain-containing protein [Lysobacter sp. cf310]|uniref:RHS repeat-associated core domain-containing protein n=1 Tax=Lysobacter sp. cf310 TaxID=1761790 RepID=UPI0008E8DDD3|nr:RHS repeat-associated core domain-containing protein [Lysobacter sp. cf310]SFK74644.1 RHS repeat-associated core domain-containing protein [Lysobacter sp. cf310]
MSNETAARAPLGPILLLSAVAGLLLLQAGVLISGSFAEPTTGGSLPPTALFASDPESDRVSAIGAEFRVDETGAATYTVPLYSAPGTAGVAPKMSLNYSSQAGNGALGKGWSIGGLSSISRCRATREAGDFIENGQPVDGSPPPVNFSDSDRYCLDGQRLVAYAGTNDACPSVAGFTVSGFRTELESFQRVCAYADGGANGPSFFTVERKDGSTSWYGDRDNSGSANRADGYVNSNAPGKEAMALTWAQTRFQDSTGNYIDYVYHEGLDGGVGEHLIHKVRYTGKTALAGQSAPASAPYAEIVFNYSAAPAYKAYIAGGYTQLAHRLDSITSTVDDDYNGSYATVRHYALTYAYGSAAQTLTQLRECNDSAQQICAAPTSFNWSQSYTDSRGFFETQESSGSIPNGSLIKFEGLKFGDIDGDGRQDLVWIKDGQTGEACGTESIYVAFSRQDPSGKPYFTVGNPVLCSPYELSWEEYEGDASWFLLDYDDDGRDDLFLSGTPNWVGYRSNGDYSQPFQTGVNLLAELAQPVPGAGSVKNAEPQHADVNGDGLIDLIYPRAGSMYVRVMERGGSYGYRWGNERLLSLLDAQGNGYAVYGLYRKSNYQQLNDFNADSRSDLLIEVSAGCSGGGGPGGPGPGPGDPPTHPNSEPVALSNATQAVVTGCATMAPFTVEQITANSVSARIYGGFQFSTSEAMSFADINGDGLTDYIVHGKSTGVPGFGINTGTGFVNGGPIDSGILTSQLQVADINADGRADIVYPRSDAQQFVVRYGDPAGAFSPAVALPNVLTGCGDTMCLPRHSYLFGDYDGDGNVDYMRVRWDDSTSPIYFSRPGPTNRFIPRDVITRFTNGLGAETDVGYAPLINKDLYRPAVGTRNAAVWGRGSPVRDVLGPAYVVWRAASSAPKSGAPEAKATLYYRYSGALMQAGGRGYLGFGAIDTIDVNHASGYVVTSNTYQQNFPFIGMPQRTVKSAVADQAYAVPACLTGPVTDACFVPRGQGLPSLGGSWFSDQTQAWWMTGAGFQAGVQAPIHVATFGTEEKLRDPFTGMQTGRTTTAFHYADYGSVARSDVTTYTLSETNPTSTVVNNNSYADDPVRWRLGRLNVSWVEHARPGKPNVVRLTTFGYSMTGPVTGLLTEERTQYIGTADQDLRKLYYYDDYGNKGLSVTCAGVSSSICSTTPNFRSTDPHEVVRYSKVTYDSRGRFPIQTSEPFYNGSTQVERGTLTVLGRNRYGAVVEAIDVNGVRTVAESGALGRDYATWNQTSPMSTPGSGGAYGYTRYRWCGTGSGAVSCPIGARFRQEVSGTAAPSSWTYFDVLGRPVMKASETFNVGVSGKDVSAVCTEYEATGKPVRTSNPFFLGGTVGSGGPAVSADVCSAGRDWTTTIYDLLGRPRFVTAPDGATAQNYYSGPWTVAVDPRGNQMTTTRNGLGEVVTVTDPNHKGLANYYNADGTVSNVNRDAGRGAVVNYFQYDVLGRKVQQTDPDAGETTYQYNAAGEVVVEQDAAGNRTENLYDARGRVWRKTVRLANGNIESQSTYNYDTATNGAGKLASETVTGAYAQWAAGGGTGGGPQLSFSRNYQYDVMGRVKRVETVIDGATYVAQTEYDELGRPWLSQDASGRWSKVEFNTRGMPSATCDVGLNPEGTQAGCPSDANTVSRTLETDAWGNAISERRGNSATMDVKRSYSTLTGRLESLCAGNASTCNLMKELYAWDAAGNLHTQQKENRYLETFTYDSLNRLVEGRQAMRDGVTVDLVTQRFAYDLIGNVCRKDDRTYRYDGNAGCGAGGLEGNGSASTSGPHRVAETVLDGGGSVFYYYDARGNQTVRDEPGTANDRTAYYSADDLAYEISLGNGTRTRFWYGSDGQRYKREDGGKTTLYLGNVEIVTDLGVTTIKRTLGGVLLQQIVGTSVTKRFLFHDRLGSLVRTATESGAVFNNMDFAAYGARRSHLTGTGSGAAPSLTTRGFTGHEHVDAVGVIHMNGRIFDPALGRFLQVDPFIQDPANPQSWNAYTYVFNNPLRYTDPSGMLGVEERQWLGAIVMIVAAATGQAYGIEGGAALAFYAAAGFVSGAVATQSLRGGVLGAMTSLMTTGMGIAMQGANPLVRAGMMALTGGVMARLQGGDFGSAFLSAGLTAGFMPHVADIGNDLGRALTGALLGGTISELTGGKFANGAVTGAIQAALAGGLQRRGFASDTYDEKTDLRDVPNDHLRKLMASTDPNDRVTAARAAARHFGIKDAGVTYGYNAHPNAHAGTMSVNGEMILGRKAFTSWARLGSTVGHEIEMHWKVHYLGRGWDDGPQKLWAGEYEAYKYNIANAARFGNTAQHVAGFRYRMNEALSNLNSANREAVLGGHYDRVY